jgi:hypothetical protein
MTLALTLNIMIDHQNNIKIQTNYDHTNNYWYQNNRMSLL